jgi:hypothetical protein
LRSPDVHLGRVSEWLLVANAVVLLGTGAWVIDDRNAAGFGLFVAAVALVHLALGGYFLWRDDATSEFGAVGTNFGMLALALAVPAALDGGWIAIGWASLFALMAWVNARTRVWWTLVWAIVFGLLGTIHLVAVEYSLNGIDSVDRLGAPFFNESGFVLISLILALVVAAYYWGRGAFRCIAVSVAGFLVLYAMPFEVTGLSLVIAWLTAALAFGALQKWPALQLVSGDAQPDADDSDSFVSIAGRCSLLSVQLVGWGLAAIYLWDEILPLKSVNQIREATTAFLNVETLAAGLLIGAAIASRELALFREMRSWWFVAAMSIAVYLIPFEVGLGPTVVLWSALALLTLSFASRDPADEVFYLVVEGAILTIAFVFTIAEVAPPTRLAVDSKTIIGHPPFLSWATATLLSIACVLSLTARRFRGRPGFEKSLFAAVALVVYALSIGVVDIFQAQAGSDASIETFMATHEGRFANLASLQKQAQVALSILWACLGVGFFVFGILKGRSPVRMIGLVLMGLATAKVFIYDLAALDASYRVLSFVGLGILLLASSYVYQRFVKQEESNDETPTASGQDLPAGT